MKKIKIKGISDTGLLHTKALDWEWSIPFEFTGFKDAAVFTIYFAYKPKAKVGSLARLRTMKQTDTTRKGDMGTG